MYNFLAKWSLRFVIYYRRSTDFPTGLNSEFADGIYCITERLQRQALSPFLFSSYI